MVILKPVSYIRRKPLIGGRYVIRTYGGPFVTRRWLMVKRIFSKQQNELVEYWYKETTLPSPEIVQSVLSATLPEHMSYQERQLILRGARMGVETLHKLLEEV